MASKPTAAEMAKAIKDWVRADRAWKTGAETDAVVAAKRALHRIAKRLAQPAKGRSK